MTDWYSVDGLPKFSEPPVVETAMAVEFPTIMGMDTYQLARLQAVWGKRFPLVESRNGTPPTNAMGDFQPMVVNLGSPITRLWASSPDNGLLVQTQSDRLILNWRKEASVSPYPGYLSTLRPEFERLWGELLHFLEQSALPAPQPTIAEFNYVNWVPLGSDDTLADVVTLVRKPPAELPGEDQFGQFAFTRQVAASATDRYTAQISTTGQPELRSDGTRHLAFTVICRAVIGARTDAPMEALDAAHALASHTFSRTVTPAKLDQWKKAE